MLLLLLLLVMSVSSYLVARRLGYATHRLSTDFKVYNNLTISLTLSYPNL